MNRCGAKLRCVVFPKCTLEDAHEVGLGPRLYC